MKSKKCEHVHNHHERINNHEKIIFKKHNITIQYELGYSEIKLRKKVYINTTDGANKSFPFSL